MPDVEELTFAAAPPGCIELPDGVALVRVDPARAPAAVRAVNESLEHLAPWLPWASEPATVERMTGLFTEGAARWDARQDFTVSIVDVASDAVVGGAGLHPRIGPHGLEIGYWVHVDHTGRGIATNASRALTDAAFAIPGIERVRICCDPENTRSARVPERLGYGLVETTIMPSGPCVDRLTQVWVIERSAWVRA